MVMVVVVECRYGGGGMNKVITQREARRNRAELKRLKGYLEQLRRAWISEWPKNCLFIGRTSVDVATAARLETARRLRHAVVVSVDGTDLTFWADPVQAEKE